MQLGLFLWFVFVVVGVAFCSAWPTLRGFCRRLWGRRKVLRQRLLGFCSMVVAGIPVVIVGGPVCYIIARTFIDVASPPLGSEPVVEIYIASLSFIAVAVCYFAWPVVSSKVSKFDDIAKKPLRNDESSLCLGIQDLRRRSRWCRLMSVFVLCFMVAVALLGFTVAADDSVQRSDENGARSDENGAQSDENGAQSDENGAQSLFDGRSLASLILLVILMRILSSIYRYNLRLASFYDARADYLRLTGNVKALNHKELLELVGTNELDTTSIREFWHSLFGRSSFHETKDTKPTSL